MMHPMSYPLNGPAIRAHRAPDPAPIEEPPLDPFDETSDPRQAPIRTPMNDEPDTDPNPSIRRLH